jgi:antitoxin (DNA-binding transcriptional repressor) of toxin-antitoxin stability system
LEDDLMSETLTVTNVARNFAEYVNRVAFRGESFVLVRGGTPVAELRPVPAGRRLRDLPAMLSALPRLDDADEFAADLESAREEMARREVPDPWES